MDWPSLSADAATAEWQALGDWVAYVLGPFYELTRAQLPDCWALHRPAVLELVWLRRMLRRGAPPRRRTAAAADWHTRWRRDALANIAAAIPEDVVSPRRALGRTRLATVAPARPTRSTPSARSGSRQHAPGQRPGPRATYRSAGTARSPPRSYWGRAFQAAAGADLAWRRQRDAAAAAGQAPRSRARLNRAAGRRPRPGRRRWVRRTITRAAGRARAARGR